MPNIQKNKVFSAVNIGLLLYIGILSFFLSRYIWPTLNLPQIVSQIATVLQYLPFAIFALWKLILDIQKKKIDLFSKFYYLFVGYYAVLTAYRFFSGMEVKDNLYIALICIGTLALYSMSASQTEPQSRVQMFHAVLTFALALAVYWIIYKIAIWPVLYFSPLNEISYGTCCALLIPALATELSNREKWDVTKCLTTVALVAMAVICTVSGSRVLFAVFLFELVALVLIFFRRKGFLKAFLSAVGITVLIVTLLFALNVQNTRYYMYREMEFLRVFDDSSADDYFADEGLNEDNSQKSDAIQQTVRSDTMRNYLYKAGLEEVKKNKLFGTGTVFFEYKTQQQTYYVPAHNVIVVTLNCFGVVGLCMLVCIAVALVIQMKLFQRDHIREKMAVILILVSYLSISMVQASFYDIMIMPAVFMILSMFSLPKNVASDRGRIE